MTPRSRQDRAAAEIETRLQGLFTSEQARAALSALQATFAAQVARTRQPATPGLAQGTEVLRDTGVYLTRSLARVDLDGRVLLDTVNTLCWDRYHEAGEALPPDLLEAADEATSPGGDLPGLWSEVQGDAAVARALAERLTWWTVANLTTNALHLEEGQAEEDLRRLWVVLAQGTPPPLPN